MLELIKFILITVISVSLNTHITNSIFPFRYGNPLMALMYIFCLLPLLIDFLISIYIKKEVYYKLLIPSVVHLGFIIMIFLLFNLNDTSEDHHFLYHLLLYNALCFLENFIYKLVQFLILRDKSPVTK